MCTRAAVWAHAQGADELPAAPGHLLQQRELPEVLAGTQHTQQLLLPVHPPAHPHL